MNYRSLFSLSFFGVASLAGSLSFAKSLEIYQKQGAVMSLNADSAFTANNPSRPPELQPIRLAKASYEITRSSASIDPGTGMPVFTENVVCRGTFEAPVFDARGKAAWWYGYKNVPCVDHFNNAEIQINASSNLMLATMSQLNQPPQDYKFFISSLFVSSSDRTITIPHSGPQNFFTKDLQQSYFGSTVSPEQYLRCDDPPPVSARVADFENSQPIIPPNAKCEFVNPVVYRVTWEVEDQP